MSTVDYQHLEEKFFLTLYESENSVLTMPGSDLLQVENMRSLIEAYGPLITANEQSVTAAFFSSWFAEICRAMQHMLLHGDKVMLDLSLSNLTVQLCAGEHYPSFTFKINELRFIDIPDKDRDTWSEGMLFSFYKDQVTPLIEVLSHFTNMKVVPLWGQIVNSLYAQVEEELAGACHDEGRQRIINLWKLLTHGVDVSAFGVRKNPFDIKPKFTEHPDKPDQQIMLKSVCCLAYRLSMGFGYCYACPRLKEKDRALMRANSVC